jgi:hypothetical protein
MRRMCTSVGISGNNESAPADLLTFAGVTVVLTTVALATRHNLAVV